MLDKSNVKRLYMSGYNATQIANIIGSNKATVQKCIQRNFGNLKFKHERAVRDRKDCLRAINYEANRYMSDTTFIKKNRSIYKTLQNGDIVVKKEFRKFITYDTPRRLTNPDKCII